MAAQRSMQADRRKAMIWSYVFLCIFVVFTLTPPIYMLITSLKTNAEISAVSENEDSLSFQTVPRGDDSVEEALNRLAGIDRFEARLDDEPAA